MLEEDRPGRGDFIRSEFLVLDPFSQQSQSRLELLFRVERERALRDESAQCIFERNEFVAVGSLGVVDLKIRSESDGSQAVKQARNRGRTAAPRAANKKQFHRPFPELRTHRPRCIGVTAASLYHMIP